MNQTMLKDNKIAYIEYLRILCTIAVIANHIPLAACNFYAASATVADNVFCHACSWANHFAVPIFVMITGVLLLNPEREVSFRKALTKYAWRMVVILLTVGWAFALMEEWAGQHSINISLFANSLYNVLAGHGWDHMWYLYMLIGLYLFIPFIKPAVNALPLGAIDALLVVLFLFASVNPVLREMVGYSLPFKFPVSSIYVLYLILGWRIVQADADWPKWIKWASLLIFCATALLLGVCSWLVYGCGMSGAKMWSEYSSPLVVLCSASLFAFCFAFRNKFTPVKQKSLVQMIAKDSFGIYLFHMLYVNILYKVFLFNPLEYNYSVFALVLMGVFILSLITTELFLRIPIIGKYI